MDLLCWHLGRGSNWPHFGSSLADSTALEEVHSSLVLPRAATGDSELSQGSWMSQSRSSASHSEEPNLREEVRELRNALRELTLRVDRVSDQLSLLTDTVAEQLPAEEEESRVTAASAGYSSAVSEQVEVPANQPPYSWDYRYGVAREIGWFIKRALEGDHRRLSGREKLKGLQNRCYIIVRDFKGQVYDPVLLVRAYSKVRNLCQENGSWGDSVFVGFASTQEASVAASTAGFSWPSEIQ